MKILCISDEVDPLVYSNNIKNRFEHVDVVISAGDLRQSYYDFIATNLNKPLYFLFGNHKLKGIEYYSKKYQTQTYAKINKIDDDPSSGAQYLDNKIINKNNLLIAGLDGSMWYNGGVNQYTEIEMVVKVLRLIPHLVINKIVHKRYIDILVTHSPPYGFYNNKDRCHTGFKIFLWFMRVFKPKYLIHGHIHLYNRNEKRMWLYHTTTIINAYNHCIINL
jgi:Icc-related predicted phosphoesterase